MSEIQPGKDYTGVGVFVLIFNKQNEILLINQKPSSKKSLKFANRWSMPGGTIEFKENSVDALKREIKEELNLEIHNLKFLNYYDSIESDRHWIALNFIAETKESPQNLEPHKIKEIKFFNQEAIPENITVDTRGCLTELKII